MCSDNKTRGRYISRNYEIARKLYRENHPCKDPNVKFRISESLKAFNKENVNKRRLPLETRSCSCGCGETFEVKPYSTKRFVGRHALRVRDTTKMREKLKSTLNSLSEDEKANRIKNSLGKCNQKERALKISQSKKGKTTKQKYYEEVKYGMMSQDDFDKFLETTSHYAIKRIINRRHAYFENLRADVDYYKKLEIIN